MKLKQRFRGFLPVIIDVETGGINPQTDALLEFAGVSVTFDDNGLLVPDKTYHYHIQAAEGTKLDPESLAFNKIDPDHPFRFAISEEQALTSFFAEIQKECKEKQCQRAVLVGHNAWFDHQFVKAACARAKIKKMPFHQFTSFDTATLSALAFGQTVLAKALKAAGLPFDTGKAHSALYDAEATALLFCYIVNHSTGFTGFSETADSAKTP